ncbi:hypothetical protein HYS97_02345 [Candidatus Daviesbacteria bacterium]|nr:hypothetical protein [Candidatus Daviesbacteria bacterium]
MKAFLILLLLAGLVAGTYLVQQRTNLIPKAQIIQTQQGSGRCDTPGNFIKNCSFEAPIGSDWKNSATVKPGSYRPEVTLSTDAHTGSQSLSIGTLDKKVCSDPKKYNGGDSNSNNFSLFADVFQRIDLTTRNDLKLEFYFKMKSEGTSAKSAPFYIYIYADTPPYPGREIFLAMPTQGSSCGSGNIQTNYTCWIEGVQQNACSSTNLSSEWKRININLNKEDLQSIGIYNKPVNIAFGVTNNMPTQVLLDDVLATSGSQTIQTRDQISTSSGSQNRTTDSQRTRTSVPFGNLNLGQVDDIENIKAQTKKAFENYKTFSKILEDIKKRTQNLSVREAANAAQNRANEGKSQLETCTKT